MLCFVLEALALDSLFLPQSASTITAPGWGTVLERGTTATSTSLSYLSPSSRSMSSPSTLSMWLSVSMQGSVCWWRVGEDLRKAEGSGQVSWWDVTIAKTPQDQLEMNTTLCSQAELQTSAHINPYYWACWPYHWSSAEDWGSDYCSVPTVVGISEVIPKIEDVFWLCILSSSAL